MAFLIEDRKQYKREGIEFHRQNRRKKDWGTYDGDKKVAKVSDAYAKSRHLERAVEFFLSECFAFERG